MRRFLSFLMASAILLAGVALASFELVRADGVRPFVLFGGLVMVVSSGAWLPRSSSCRAGALDSVFSEYRVGRQRVSGQSSTSYCGTSRC
jgi:hypothetical protein